MSNLTRYGVANMDQLLDRITRNSVGMDEYFDNIFGTAQGNYPPYNLIQESNTRSRLEIALAGFKKDEVNVYTEYGKLIVEGKKEDKEEENFVSESVLCVPFRRTY
jgi:molecular chaperone IbpA